MNPNEPTNKTSIDQFNNNLQIIPFNNPLKQC